MVLIKRKTYKRKIFKNKTYKSKTYKSKTYKKKIHKNKRKNTSTIRKNKRTVGSGKYPIPKTPRANPYSKSNECRYGVKCNNFTEAHRYNFEHNCKYGDECYREDPSHKFMFHNPILLNDDGIRLYTNDNDIRAELEQSYKLFDKSSGDPNYTEWYVNKGNFNPAYHNVMRMVYEKDSVDAKSSVSVKYSVHDIKKTFYFKLLEYIACHLCELLRKYDSNFISRLLTLLETENVTGIFDKHTYGDSELNKCLDKLNMPNLSNSELLTALTKIREAELNPISEYKICSKD